MNKTKTCKMRDLMIGAMFLCPAIFITWVLFLSYDNEYLSCSHWIAVLIVLSGISVAGYFLIYKIQNTNCGDEK